MTLLEGAARPAAQADPRPADPPPTPSAPGRKPPDSPAVVLRLASGILALLLLVLLLNLVAFSRVEHSVAQTSQFAAFRKALAEGVAPTGQVDIDGHLLRPGTPVAQITIPAIGVDEVVGEGTTGELLTKGPGHLRDTVLPGGAGISEIFGRAAAYGGPFGGLGALHKGDAITVVDGLGRFGYRVLDVRRAGDRAPHPPRVGASRLILLTASGTSFLPSGVLRVDADLVKGSAQPVPVRRVVLASSELPLKADTSTLWATVLWLEGLLALVVGAVLAWTRWGHAQAWICALPPGLLVLYFLADQITRTLPNLL